MKSHICNLKRIHVVYQVNCSVCKDFYVGLTTRQVSQRMKEHSSSNTSALYRHTIETKHSVDVNSPKILAFDSNKSRLFVKESLLIRETGAYKSLNGNVGSVDLRLW